MKTMKISLIAVIITALIIVSCAYAMPAQAERPEFYPKLTVVVSSVRIDSRLWVVDCKDKEGHIWSFFDEDGTWVQGDLANLLMWALNEVEEDDEIVEVYWVGYTEDINHFFQIIEGRP